MKRLMMGIATVAVVATAAHAQAPFADVPRDHWAYDAVNTLAQRGLVIGYPDGTFGGKRAMTRYEFAVVIARMIPQLESYIRDQVANATPKGPDLSNYVTKDQLGNYVTREDFDTLRRLVDQFAPELQMLQVDVAGLRRDLNDLRGRVATLEEEVGRVSVHGELNAIGRLSATNRDTLKSAANYAVNTDPLTGYTTTGAPTDIDGRPLNRTTNLLEAAQVLYDMDLGITAKVSKTVTANALLNIGNYMGGFAGASVIPGVPPFDRGAFPYGNTSRGSLNAEISPLKVYIEAPVSIKPLGLIDIEAGKTGVQFTPYTLKLVDYDSYTNISATDNGDVIFTGLKGKARIGGVGLTAYAGTHGTSLLSGGQDINGTFANGSGYPVLFTGGVYGPSFIYSADQNGIGINTVPEALYGSRTINGTYYAGLPILIAPATQSAGVRATIGTPFGGTLGLNYINAGINNAFVSNGLGIVPGQENLGALNAGRASVYGADLALNLFRGIGVNAEYANSNIYQAGTKFKFSNDNSLFTRKLHEAYDARVTFGLSKLALSAGYKRVDPFFGAPGAWGAIGRWKNPTNIKGFVGTAGVPLAKGLSLAGSFEDYRSIVAGLGTGATTADAFGAALVDDDSTKISRWTAGLKFDLTSNNRVDLGVETVYTTPSNILNPARNKSTETFYNLGYGTNLSNNASFKLLYQIIDYRDKGANFLNNGQDSKGSVAVGQFTVKF